MKYRSKEQKFQETKVPPMEHSFLGTKVLGYECSIIPASYTRNRHRAALYATTAFNNNCHGQGLRVVSLKPHGPTDQLTSKLRRVHWQVGRLVCRCNRFSDAGS